MSQNATDAVIASLNTERLAAHLRRLAAAQPATRRDVVPLMSLMDALLGEAGITDATFAHPGEAWGAREKLKRALLMQLPGVPGVRHVESDS
jgi:hypothetical protein